MLLRHLRVVKCRFIIHLCATRRGRCVEMERFLTKNSLSKRTAANQDQAETELAEPQRKKQKEYVLETEVEDLTDNVPQYARPLELAEDTENVTHEVPKEINVIVGDATATNQEARPTPTSNSKGPEGNFFLELAFIFLLSAVALLREERTRTRIRLIKL